MNVKKFIELTNRTSNLDSRTGSGDVDYAPTAQYTAIIDSAIKKAVKRNAKRRRRLHLLLLSTVLIELLLSAVLFAAAR